MKYFGVGTVVFDEGQDGIERRAGWAVKGIFDELMARAGDGREHAGFAGSSDALLELLSGLERDVAVGVAVQQ